MLERCKFLIMGALCAFSLVLAPACGGGDGDDDSTDIGDTGVPTDGDSDTGDIDPPTDSNVPTDTNGNGDTDGPTVTGPETACGSPVQECTSDTQSSETYFCDTEAGRCRLRCNAATADDTGSSDCPTGHWCLPLSGDEELETEGVCIPGDCEGSIFENNCAPGETCFPVGRNASFCVAGGTRAAGESCGTGETCDAGLLCRAGTCVAPCDLAGTAANAATCEGEETCLPVFDTTNTNRPGACGVGCPAFSIGECPEGLRCEPALGRAGVNTWFCDEAGANPAGPGQSCDAANGCVEGYICLNEGTEENPNLTCSQLCDTSGTANACSPVGEATEVIAATAYGEVSGYVTTTAGEVGVEARHEDGTLVAPLTLDLTGETASTAVAALDEDGDLTVLVFTDDNDGEAIPATWLRVLHASGAAGEVDAAIAMGVVEGLGFGETTGFVGAPLGDINALVFLAGTASLGAELPATIAEDMAYTVLAYGDATDEADGLVFAVGATATNATTAADTVGIRVFHAALNAPPSVDIYVNLACTEIDTDPDTGEETCITYGSDAQLLDVAYGSDALLGAYTELAEGDFTLYFFAEGADAVLGDEEFSVDVESPAPLTTLVAHDEGEEGVGLLQLADNVSADAGDALLSVVHVATNVGAVDIAAEAGLAIDGVGFGADTDFIEVTGGLWALTLRSDDEVAFTTGLFELEENNGLTAIFVNGDGGLTMVTDTTAPAMPAAGDAAIRFVHGVPGVDPVAIVAPGGVATTCFPAAVDGFGFCLEQCTPYPRQGQGNYGCSDDEATCRPFQGGQAGATAPIDGICIDFGAGERGEPGSVCETEFSLNECEDLGFCFGEAFEQPANTCRELCQPFSSGQCSDDGFCSPIFPLNEVYELAFCEYEDIVPGGLAPGDPCPANTENFICNENALCGSLQAGTPPQCIHLCTDTDQCVTGTCSFQLQAPGIGFCN